jgi:hypothetical protein
MKNVVTSSLNDEMIAHTCIIRCPSTLHASRLQQEDEPVSKKMRQVKDELNSTMSSSLVAVSTSSSIPPLPLPLMSSSSLNSVVCVWQGTIVEVQQHMKECAFHVTDCPFLGCTQAMLRSQLAVHVQLCSHRTEPCAQCDEDVVFGEAEAHKLTCSMRIIHCPNGCVSESTGEVRRLQFGSLNEHLDVCEEQVVVCKYNEYGCGEMGTRMTIRAHEMDADSGVHTQILLSIINDLKQKLLAKECLLEQVQQCSTSQQGLSITAKKGDTLEMLKNCVYFKLFNAVRCGDAAAWTNLCDKSAADDLDAKVYVMLLYQSGTLGNLVPVDKPKAIEIATYLLPWMLKESKKRANTRSIHAMFGLGCCQYHDTALVLPTNDKEAVRLFQKARRRGHVVASSILGCCFRNGYGRHDKDEAKAKAFYIAAAEAGYVEAMYIMGMNIDQHAESSTGNVKETAFSWYLRAAKLGHCASQYIVGISYINNVGVQGDTLAGESWLRLAAEQGYPPAVEY